MSRTSANRLPKREFEYLEPKHLLTCIESPLAEVQMGPSETDPNIDNGLVEGGALELGLRGDIDCDGSVGFKDFLTLCANFGIDNPSFEQGDVDGDNQIGFKDFLELAANYGASEETGNNPDVEPEIFIPPVDEIIVLTSHPDGGHPISPLSPFPDREWEDGFWCPPCGMG